MNKKQMFSIRPVTGLGLSSILVVFVQLVLVCLAVLSLASSLADSRLSRQTVQYHQQYYAAFNQANQVLQQVDESLQQAGQSSGDYLQEMQKKLKQIDCLTFTQKETVQVQYECPINETQSLFVSLIIPYHNFNPKAMYQIAQWQVITTQPWAADTQLPIYMKN